MGVPVNESAVREAAEAALEEMVRHEADAGCDTYSERMDALEAALVGGRQTEEPADAKS